MPRILTDTGRTASFPALGTTERIFEAHNADGNGWGATYEVLWSELTDEERVEHAPLPDAVQAALTAHRMTYWESMLYSWDIDVPEGAEAREKAYNAEYSRRCETMGVDSLDSEDYEAIDYNEGWETGFYEAVRAYKQA